VLLALPERVKGDQKLEMVGWTKADNEITARPSPAVGAEAGASVTAPTQRRHRGGTFYS
jgi:hypothetical protein